MMRRDWSDFARMWAVIGWWEQWSSRLALGAIEARGLMQFIQALDE